MVEAAVTTDRAPHPVAFDVEYPERLSRLTTFFRLILVIPQFFVLYLLQLVFGLLTFIAWFAILFTGRYPRGLFDFNAGVLRWSANVSAYTALLRDEYPPFSTDAGKYAVTFDLPYPERLSRIRLFVRFFTIIPNQIVLGFVQFGWFFTTVFSWFAILIGGKYPRGLHTFAAGVLRWQYRSQAYSAFLRDEYPPYSLRREASPGNEVVSGVIGFPIFIAYIGFYIFWLTIALSPDSTTIDVTTPLDGPTFASEAPSGEANNVRVTLLGYDPSASSPNGNRPDLGYRFVSFDYLAEKDGFLPSFFAPFLFELQDCADGNYFIEDAVGTSWFEVFWTGGEDDGTLFFEFPQLLEPCTLVYHAGLGEIRFEFAGN